MLFIAQYISFFWFILGIFFILLELKLGFSAIYFFFTGLSSITVGFLLTWNFLDPNNYTAQLIVFFVSLICFSAVLWKPIKSFMISYDPDNQFKNIVGQSAYVANKPLKKGKKGEVKWSGTVVYAKLDASEKMKELAVGEEVEIVEIVENVFIVKSKDN
jgi:membrane protein implicated in regulation of membrane protease activity